MPFENTKSSSLVASLLVGGEPCRGRRTGKGRLVNVVGNRARHVGVDAEQFRSRLHAHLFGDDGAPIAALRHVLRVPQALHQHAPGTRDVGGIPAGGGRLARVPVARNRRNHQMERIRCAPAMRGGIGQGIDDLHLLDDRAGPSVRDDERQRVVVLRANMNEVNVQSIDLGDELRQSVQSRLDLAPVVVCRPIAPRSPERSRAAHLALHPRPFPCPATLSP